MNKKIPSLRSSRGVKGVNASSFLTLHIILVSLLLTFYGECEIQLAKALLLGASYSSFAAQHLFHMKRCVLEERAALENLHKAGIVFLHTFSFSFDWLVSLLFDHQKFVSRQNNQGFILLIFL